MNTHSRQNNLSQFRLEPGTVRLANNTFSLRSETD